MSVRSSGSRTVSPGTASPARLHQLHRRQRARLGVGVEEAVSRMSAARKDAKSS